ncbi:MAG: hypothetical protein ACOCP8_00460 [archaeon]
MPKKINLNKKKKDKSNKKTKKDYFKLILGLLVAIFMLGSMFMSGSFLNSSDELDYNEYSFNEREVELQDSDQVINMYELDYENDILEFIYHPTMINSYPNELSSIIKEERKITLIQPSNLTQIQSEAIEFSFGLFTQKLSKVYEEIDYDVYMGSLENNTEYTQMSCNQSEFKPMLLFKEGNKDNYWDDNCYVYYLSDFRNSLEVLEAINYQMLEVVPIQN